MLSSQCTLLFPNFLFLAFPFPIPNSSSTDCRYSMIQNESLVAVYPIHCPVSKISTPCFAFPFPFISSTDCRCGYDERSFVVIYPIQCAISEGSIPFFLFPSPGVSIDCIIWYGSGMDNDRTLAYVLFSDPVLFELFFVRGSFVTFLLLPCFIFSPFSSLALICSLHFVNVAFVIFLFHFITL